MLTYGYLEIVEQWAGCDQEVLEDDRSEGVELRVNRENYTKDVLENQKYNVSGYEAYFAGDFAKSASDLITGAKTADEIGSSRAFPAMAATAEAFGMTWRPRGRR